MTYFMKPVQAQDRKMVFEVEQVLNCTRISDEIVRCNGSEFHLPEKRLTYRDEWFWIYIGIYTGLVLIAGLMSGLTMGLLSLDPTTLTVLRASGTEKERRHASRILPLVGRHHLLLVTLLLANAAAVEAMPIFLDRVSDPITAIVASVTAVLLFGEVIPQAICTRYGLAIGAFLAPFVYFLMALLFLIAWPISKLLDCTLGHDHGTFYRRGQLKALVDMHGPDTQGQGHGRKDEQLTIDEVLIIKGALDMKFKTASTAMVPIADVFMINLNAKLDHDTMNTITSRGHSRVPVFAGDRSNVIALLLTKTLMQLSPVDATPVATVLQSPRYARAAMFVDEDMPLYDLLNQFQTGKSHLAMVRRKSSQPEGGANSIQTDGNDTQPLLTIEDEPLRVEDVPSESDIVGVITLEDVLEELLQEEIEDENDTRSLHDVSGLLRVAMATTASARKGKLLRTHSQPEGTPTGERLSASVRIDRHHSEAPAEIVTSTSVDPPLLTF